MTTVFQFIVLWESLSREEKDYLIAEFEYGINTHIRSVDKNGEVVLSRVEEYLLQKGILETSFNGLGTTILQIKKELAWVFSGLKLTTSAK